MRLAASVAVELADGAAFVSDAELDQALASTDLTDDEQQALLDANENARLRTLQAGAVAIALVALAGLFVSRGIPARAIVTPAATAPT